MARGERLRWRDAVICGLLWGLVVVLAVSLNQPVGDLNLSDLRRWLASLAIIWCATGLIWSMGCKIAEERRRPVLIMPAVFGGAWAVSMLAAYAPLIPQGAYAPGDFGRLAHLPVFDLSVYSLWINLFYGGLYTLGFFATRRTLRLRRRLAELRLARSQAEAKLRETRLQAVRGQIQPAMLLDALDALRLAYARDQAAGDAMFDLLIAFLRAAMPGLRSGASTLAAELAVIDRYAALREALEAGPPAWRLKLKEPPPDLAFPPLRLLPALDRMSRATPADAAVEVTAEAASDVFVVRVGAPAPAPLPVALMARLRIAMRRDLGVGDMMSAEPGGALVAELRVRMAAAVSLPRLAEGIDKESLR
jgi:hypothetical protein